MVSSDLKIPPGEIAGRLQRLMFLRVAVVSLLLGASIFVQVKQTRTYFGEIQTFHYSLVAAIYFLTFVYVVLLKRLKALTNFAYLQLLVDTFFVTAVIYGTGGIESIFSFLYILTIINGSILLYRRGGMIIASSSSILYGLLLDLQYYGVIRPIGSLVGYSVPYQSVYIFYMILVNVAAFYLVAFLSSYASEQARRSRVELRAKEDDLLELEALNEWIIRSITSGLITLDRHNRVILFNPAAEEIFGTKAMNAVGAQAVTVLPFLKEQLEKGPDLPDFGTKRTPRFMDLPYVRGDGKRLSLRCSISPLSLPDGGRIGKILFFQDMTEMKRIEEEMKRVEHLALIGELAAGIAHEIRNPMASISGSIQVLKEDLGKTDVDSRLMDIVLRETGRLDHLVSDFLLFARPRQAEIQSFSLKQVILDSLELFENRPEEKNNIRIETHFPHPVLIESDPEQLKQVLWNLFLNAREAMPEGGCLYVSADSADEEEPVEPGETMVRIRVRDTGAGLSAKALLHLFTPFFTTKEGGTGLGLAIVKRIVEGLKGRVHGRNHPEGGAEITILLPGSGSFSDGGLTNR